MVVLSVLCFVLFAPYEYVRFHIKIWPPTGKIHVAAHSAYDMDC